MGRDVAVPVGREVGEGAGEDDAGEEGQAGVDECRQPGQLSLGDELQRDRRAERLRHEQPEAASTRRGRRTGAIDEGRNRAMNGQEQHQNGAAGAPARSTS